jgi:hypothetical protein
VLLSTCQGWGQCYDFDTIYANIFGEKMAFFTLIIAVYAEQDEQTLVLQKIANFSTKTLVKIAANNDHNIDPWFVLCGESLLRSTSGFRVVLRPPGRALRALLVALRRRHGHGAQRAAARHVSDFAQGCQMLYFLAKNFNLGKFWNYLQ